MKQRITQMLNFIPQESQGSELQFLFKSLSKLCNETLHFFHQLLEIFFPLTLQVILMH